MKINHEIIRCPDGTYAIWQGDTLVSEGWRTVEDARLHAAAVALGRKGGQAKSGVKTEAARKNARRGGRPKKRAGRWPYAVQVQPRNGERQDEVVGLDIVYRDWNNADRKRFPEAEKALEYAGTKLVVDVATNLVYAVYVS